MEDLNQSADARMRVAAEQSQVVVTAGFRQLWLTVGAVFGLLILYRVAVHFLTRRRPAVVLVGGAGEAANGNGSAAGTRLAPADDAAVPTGV
jgi:hypothetical protein